ncbi:rod shape-determining protein [candidate division WWE3 bacterium CG09_land_8_20_14_0_10_39_24]|uniref:Cell shape-determining protein MreB n=2 Tax=Katanobacteria TaxID=422282 RepID=A0A2G9XCC4_UNCKA|nr:MAG: rod shape-determining protein [bacterium CG2_30_40_12]OJI09706.1 MAG: rod shape-determining protein [bacterium CG09_39_24]PIP04614.1 MAG: rod shape-determining protein [candidate division WWE3 bacterium CG23_combo_of_CG06-09_8_20_14_all_40_14]PIS13178.1 MAG: rod shape-determining protein [candidate division WWE3 bacterium CG09_land_8_20_14_0_10_39_24]PJE52189.1 MAG: rod shape-determining protein [candidate division WWE3 bacterium CG10_big_fil_rev_8_21_14_0_10_39_14]
MFSKKIAIDLGTANSLVYVSGKGVIINEPTVVAVSVGGGDVIAVGNSAKEMIGRTPEGILPFRPLKDGVIADYSITEAMLKYFLNKALGRVRFMGPTILIAVPAGVSSVESRAVIESAFGAGAKTAFLMPEPLAASIGAGLPISAASGNMIVNSGGGTTEIAIVSLGGLVVHGSVRVAGNKIDEAIASYIRRKYGLIIGDKTAEQLKIKIGSALMLEKEIKAEVKGRDFVEGLPKTLVVTSSEITAAIEPTLKQIAQAIKEVLSRTPPELSADVLDKGIVMSGGTALLKNFDKYITKATGIPAHIADSPLFCVIKGLGTAVENLGVFEKALIVK